MNPRTRGEPRSKHFQEGNSHWILIAGGALLSTLSIRLGYMFKQALDTKQLNNTSQCLKGSRNVVEVKLQCNGEMMAEPEMALPVVTVPTPEFNEDNDMMWSTSPDRLELSHKPVPHSDSSESPRVSETGSDIFGRREVMQKLRQQLKRRDDMVLEMQDQIAELQLSLTGQLSHSARLQSMLDAAHRDLLDSEREIQRLRKAIADNCVGHVNSGEQGTAVSVWPVKGTDGHANGYFGAENKLEPSDKGREVEKIEILQREVNELKEGKDYLLQSYKAQNLDLTMNIKKLQQSLDSHLLSIL